MLRLDDTVVRALRRVVAADDHRASTDDVRAGEQDLVSRALRRRRPSPGLLGSFPFLSLSPAGVFVEKMKSCSRRRTFSSRRRAVATRGTAISSRRSPGAARRTDSDEAIPAADVVHRPTGALHPPSISTRCPGVSVQIEGARSHRQGDRSNFQDARRHRQAVRENSPSPAGKRRYSMKEAECFEEEARSATDDAKCSRTEAGCFEARTFCFVTTVDFLEAPAGRTSAAEGVRWKLPVSAGNHRPIDVIRRLIEVTCWPLDLSHPFTTQNGILPSRFLRLAVTLFGWSIHAARRRASPSRAEEIAQRLARVAPRDSRAEGLHSCEVRPAPRAFHVRYLIGAAYAPFSTMLSFNTDPVTTSLDGGRPVARASRERSLLCRGATGAGDAGVSLYALCVSCGAIAYDWRGQLGVGAALVAWPGEVRRMLLRRAGACGDCGGGELEVTTRG